MQYFEQVHIRGEEKEDPFRLREYQMHLQDILMTLPSTPDAIREILRSTEMAISLYVQVQLSSIMQSHMRIFYHSDHPDFLCSKSYHQYFCLRVLHSCNACYTHQHQNRQTRYSHKQIHFLRFSIQFSSTQSVVSIQNQPRLVNLT